MRQEVARLVHDVDALFLVLEPDVDVHAEDQQAVGDVGHRFAVLEVALALGDLLVAPTGKGVGRGGGDPQAVSGGDLGDPASQAHQLRARLRHSAADLRPDLDLRAQELGLDLVLQDLAALLQELLDVGRQLTSLRVDDLVLLLDSDGELGQGHGANSSLVMTTCVGNPRSEPSTGSLSMTPNRFESNE